MLKRMVSDNVMKKIALSFDVEEFDLPREFNSDIDDEEMYQISYYGCKKLLNLLDVPATFFVTANFAKKYPKLIKEISEKNEIGLHADEHKDNYEDMSCDEANEKLTKAKKEIEKIINKKIKGFRAPRFYPPDYKLLKKLGFEYDSSLNPCFIPGRYNNMFKKRKIHFNEGLKVIPASVYPVIRFPMTFLCFRFFNRFSLVYEKIGTVLNKEYVIMVLHPWDFMDLRKFKIPFFIKKNSGEVMYGVFKDYIKWCKNKGYGFTTMEKF